MPVRDCGSVGKALGAVKMSTMPVLSIATDELAVGDEEPLLVGGHALRVVQPGGEGNGFAIFDQHRPTHLTRNVNLPAQADRQRGRIIQPID